MRRLLNLLILSFFSILLLNSCQKHADKFEIGLYTESSPVAGRSQMHFISDDVVVVRGIPGYMATDTAHYEIRDGRIFLTPDFSFGVFVGVGEFTVIDDRTIRIQIAVNTAGPEWDLTLKK